MVWHNFKKDLGRVSVESAITEVMKVDSGTKVILNRKKMALIHELHIKCIVQCA